MEAVTRIKSVRERIAEWRRQNLTVAFISTMGGLHKGHQALISEAKAKAKRVVVSVFVNPLQFGPDQDFGRYPRTIERDTAVASDSKVDLLFAPTTFEIYPGGFERCTRVDVPELARILKGQFHPTYFEGVATITTKMLQIVQPDLIVMGEKDYQQLVIVRRLVSDLCMPVTIVSVPVVRDHDGLAFGTSNRQMSARERNLAPRLYETLKQLRKRLKDGERDYPALQEAGMKELERAGFEPDYFSIRQSSDLMPPRYDSRELVLLASARIGETRLIDSMRVQLPPRL